MKVTQKLEYQEVEYGFSLNSKDALFLPDLHKRAWFFTLIGSHTHTEQVLDCKDALVDAFEKAKRVIKQAIPAATQEIERMRLELELIRAKQHYQDTGHAIALSTSPAMLQWLRGETPAPVKVEYRDRFVDPATGQEVGSSSGRSLTQLIADAGLNPKSKRDRQLI